MTIDQVRRIRDVVDQCLLARRGLLLTPEVARERANNIATALIADIDDIVTAALKDAARGEVITGEIDGARPRSLAGETGMTLEEHVTDFDEPPFK